MTGELTSLSPGELTALMEELHEPSYRGGQIYAWIHRRGVEDISLMSDIPLALRKRLAADYRLAVTEPAEILSSPSRDTVKYALRLHDGEVVEAVYMRHSYGTSVCISSQAGCALGCRFCASGLTGYVRDLSAGEMLSEVYTIGRDRAQRISHIDIMGTGEPLMNMTEVLRFIRMISDSDGLHISQRNIALSTSGIPERIEQLSREKLAITLCLSLHAASDEKRRLIMPGAARYSLRDLIPSCRHYQERTGRRVSYEYILIADVNDTAADIAALTRLLPTGGEHIDLIALNPVPETGLRAPTAEKVRWFRDQLCRAGKNVTIRRSRGREIDSACGQLRRRFAGTVTD